MTQTVWRSLWMQEYSVAIPDGMKQRKFRHNGPVDSLKSWFGTLLSPEKSTNFAFGGPSLDMLYIAATSSIYSLKMKTFAAPSPGVKTNTLGGHPQAWRPQ